MHIPGVGEHTQSLLKQNNIETWFDYLKNYHTLNFIETKKETIHEHILKSIEAYNTQNYTYFSEQLPQNEHWRAYKHVKDIAFLDIETSGSDKLRDYVTVIGVYNGTESKFYINGINIEDFEQEIEKYDMFVTFNGRCFDIPFLKTIFPRVDFNKFHLDLRFALKELGYTGGLKSIEKQLGIDRGDELEGVDGWEAVHLWHRYKHGNKAALALLLKYNRADIENLKFLADFAYDQLKTKHLYSLNSINQS